MFRNNFFYYLKLLLKTKYKIRAPRSSEVVIYDHGAEQLSFLEFNKCSIFYNRGEEVNLYILFKTIFLNGFLNITENYRITYIKYINPKFIITYKCDNKHFYELKKNIKNIKTILIQWGKTAEGYFKYFKNQNNDFNVDEMYLYGEETAKIFSKFIKGKTFSIGSIANNRYKYNEKIRKNSLVFISQAKSGRIFPEIEKLVLRCLKDFCTKNNLCLSVSTRVLYNDKIGKENYKNILGQTGWNYYPRKIITAAGDYEHYKRVMTSEYVVGIESTLAYEALSRKKKVAFFPFGSYSPDWCKINYLTDPKTKAYAVPSKFGYPLKLSSEGKFWLSDYDLDKMEQKLNFLLKVDDSTWLKLLNEIEIDKIVKFDLYNKTLINNLERLGVPLQKDNLMI